MASLLPQGKQVYTDSAGDPLAGGLLYTYAAGTSTPLATYSSQAGTTPNANPVVLDSRGEATVFWSGASYKVVLHDSADAPIWTQDNVGPEAVTATGADTARTQADWQGAVKGWRSPAEWGNHAALTGAHLASAAAQAVTDGVGLLIAHPVTISTAIDLGTVPIRVEGRGKFVRSGSGTLTGTGTLTAPIGQIFDGWSAGLTFSWKVEHVVPQWWGAAGDGVTDDTAAIQAAIVVAAAINGHPFFPPGVYLYSTLTVYSDVTLCGPGGTAATLRQIQPTNAAAGFLKAAGAGSLAHFHVRDLAFDGARVATPGNIYTHVFDIELAAGESVADVSWENCDFRDAQCDFIRIHSNAATGTGARIRVVGNRFQTTAAKRSLGGTAYVVSMDAVRIEYENAGNTPGTYGTAPFTDIEVTGNYAESIRTLGDLKRGCKSFIVAQNRSVNMYDCHQSVDGGFDGIITDNVGRTDAGYTPTTTGNFIEVQGERVSVHDNAVDGGGVLRWGIMISDYGRPEETVGAGHQLGHPSSGVIVSKNTIRNVTTHGVRLINARACAALDNFIDTVGVYPVVIEAPGTSYDGTDTVLAPLACRISGNSSKAAVRGVSASAGSGHIVGLNPDENGQDYVYQPGMALASTYGLSRRDAAHQELNPNPLLLFAGSAANNLLLFGATYYPAAAAAVTAPAGVPRATTLNDESAASLRQHQIGQDVPATAGTRIYGRLWIKKNTATSCCILVQEYTAGVGFLSSAYIAIASPVAWTEYVWSYLATQPTCGLLRVSIIPASAGNYVTDTGTTDFANVRLARTAIPAETPGPWTVPLQSAAQADSVAATLAAMVLDFNALLTKLRAAGLQA